jgi:hypothetical protein
MGFVVVSKVMGDLNGDRLSDIAVHIKGTSPRFITKLSNDEYDANPRVLIILFKTAVGNGYQLIEQNNKLITTPDSPAMTEPFQRMSIAKGILKLELELWTSAGSWGATNGTYKLRYQNGRFFLIGADREDYRRNDIEMTTRSYNFLTGKVKYINKIRPTIENPSAYDRKPIIKWRKIPRLQLRPLKDLGPAFSWEVERDYFI